MVRIINYQCERCGYDLTGLASAGRCPECGRRFDKQRHYGVRERRSEGLAGKVQGRPLGWVLILAGAGVFLVILLVIGFVLL